VSGLRRHILKVIHTWLYNYLGQDMGTKYFYKYAFDLVRPGFALQI